MCSWKSLSAPLTPKMTTLSRADVLSAVRGLLPVLERLADDVRMVGTASSLLRGIDLPVGDVDILARQRPIVDELATSATAMGGMCLSSPAWDENPWFGQYLSEFDLCGVHVGFSTVEVKPAHPVGIGECTRDAPWEHFDILEIEGHRLPFVASRDCACSPRSCAPGQTDGNRSGRTCRAMATTARHCSAAALQDLPPDLQAIMRDAVRDKA